MKPLKKDWQPRRNLCFKAVNEGLLAQLKSTQTIFKSCEWQDVEADADEMGSFEDQRNNGGYGVSLTIRLVRCWLMCFQTAKTRRLSNSKHCWNLLELCIFIPTVGELNINVGCSRYHFILILLFIPSGKPILKQLNVNISPSEQESSVWLAKRFSFSHLSGCMMSSLVYSSTAMNLV